MLFHVFHFYFVSIWSLTLRFDIVSETDTQTGDDGDYNEEKGIHEKTGEGGLEICVTVFFFASFDVVTGG